MYYSFYDNDDASNCSIKFDERKINSQEEVNEEIEYIFKHLFKFLRKNKIHYDSCGIIPCIGLFVKEDDIKRYFKCSSVEDEFRWTFSGIDILDEYVSISMTTTYYKDGDRTVYLGFDSDEKPIFIMKYSDFLTAFNLFKYRLEHMPRTFNDYKRYFILERSVYANDDDYDEPSIVYYNPQPRTDTQIISFQDAINARRLKRP